MLHILVEFLQQFYYLPVITSYSIHYTKLYENIAKHARARHVEVTLWKTPQRTLLEISDDGRGFDFEKKKMSIGHGLANMQTRARNVGGDVEFTSEPNQGTTILAWIPNDDEHE